MPILYWQLNFILIKLCDSEKKSCYLTYTQVNIGFHQGFVFYSTLIIHILSLTGKFNVTRQSRNWEIIYTVYRASELKYLGVCYTCLKIWIVHEVMTRNCVIDLNRSCDRIVTCCNIELYWWMKIKMRHEKDFDILFWI